MSPRQLSASTLASMYDEETGDGPIMLLTIDHEGLPAPILISSDATQRVRETDREVIYGTVSRGEEFLFFPFEMVLPSDEEGGVPNVRLSIDNLTAEITDAVRELTSPPVILFEVVMMADPDVVEMSLPDFLLTDVEWTRERITATVSMDMLLTERMGYTYRPTTHPGVFK